MSRKIDKKHRLWIKSKAEELMKLDLDPPLNKVQIAERLGVHRSTLAVILREDGRTVKRKERNNV